MSILNRVYRLRGSSNVAVVIPAFNEQFHIASVVQGLPNWVDHTIVVDDGSSDRTAEIVRGIPGTILVSHPKRRGVGAAIATGYRRAMACGADVVAVMAGDNQMRPDELDRLVDPVIEGTCDYTKGNRLGHPDAMELMPRFRRFGTRSLAVLTRWVTGLPELNDAQCGYTAISRQMLERLDLDTLYPRYGYPNDLLAMLAEAGGTVKEPVVTPVYAGERSDLRPALALFTHSWVLLRSVMLRRLRKNVAANASNGIVQRSRSAP